MVKGTTDDHCEAPLTDPSTPAPRRGRRAARTAPDSGVPEEFIAEVLNLAGESPMAQPATAPAPPWVPAPAPADPRPAGAMPGFVVIDLPEDDPEPPAAATPPPFFVYEAPEPAAAYDPPAPQPHVYDPSRDVGVTERPDFYDDPTETVSVHGAKFRPGQTLSTGKRSAFKANRHGAPIFSPGWDATRAARHYARTSAALIALAIITGAGAGALVVQGVGTDTHYQDILRTGTVVTATVNNTTLNTEMDSDGIPLVQQGGTKTTEKASIEFIVDGKTFQRELTHVSTGEKAMTGEASIWSAGDKIDVVVDPADTARVAAFDPAAPGPLNWISLSPLLLTAGFMAGATNALVNRRKMKAIAKHP